MSENVISDSAFPEKYSSNKVVSAKKRTARSSNTKAKKDNTISSNAADYSLAKKGLIKPKEQEDVKKVALWSDRNKHLVGAGSLKTGYNIVNKEASELWLKAKGVRLATPEEIASYYGK
jgi:hypothetical protein